MLNEPFWLTADEAIEYNRLAVHVTGEPFFVRDRPMLESAIASPRNHWVYGENRIGWLAATLLLAIARDHPFAQGNKRAALLAAKGMCELNGHALSAPDAVYDIMILAALSRSCTADEFRSAFTLTVESIERYRTSLRNSGFRLRDRKRWRLPINPVD